MSMAVSPAKVVLDTSIYLSFLKSVVVGLGYRQWSAAHALVFNSDDHPHEHVLFDSRQYLL